MANMTGNMYSYEIMKRISEKSEYDLTVGTACLFIDNREISFDQVGIVARIEKGLGDKYTIVVEGSRYDLEGNSLNFIVNEIDNEIASLLTE